MQENQLSSPFEAEEPNINIKQLLERYLHYWPWVWNFALHHSNL
jgi:hypothetical protein